jgi:hypothetical protein
MFDKNAPFGEGRIRLGAPVLIAVLLTSICVGQSTDAALAAPMTLNEIENALNALRIAEDRTRLANIVARRGVDFKFSESAEQRLLAAKADSALMLAVAAYRRVIAPKDDWEECELAARYDCWDLLLCVAPDVDDANEIKNVLGCGPAGIVHHSQILKDDPYEFEYRRLMRTQGVPQAFLFVQYLGKSALGGNRENYDEALQKARKHVAKLYDLIPSGPRELGVRDATDDLYRLGKYQNKCSFTLGADAEALSLPLPPGSPLIGAINRNTSGPAACPAGYSSHMCNEGMQILCVSPNFSQSDISRLESAASWKAAACRAEDTPVPASAIRGDPYNAGFHRGFGPAAPVTVVRAVNLDKANTSDDVNLLLLNLGIHSLAWVAVDPIKSPDCTWSMAWERGYYDGRKTYIGALARAQTKAKQIEATQKHQK